MIPEAGLKLCTFEVVTHVGRHARAGAYRDGRIMDINFAAAWYLDQTGEAEAQRFADALVPAHLPDFLRAGLRAMHTAEELFLGAGPEPADWWKIDSPPHGQNGETLVYRPEEVRILPPLPGRGVSASGEPVLDGEWLPQLAVVTGARGAIGGYTPRIECGRSTAMGPWLVTRDAMKNCFELTVRVNGRETARGVPDGILEAASAARDAAPCDVFSFALLGGAVTLRPGDVLELESPSIGVLRNHAA